MAGRAAGEHHLHAFLGLEPLPAAGGFDDGAAGALHLDEQRALAARFGGARRLLRRCALEGAHPLHEPGGQAGRSRVGDQHHEAGAGIGIGHREPSAQPRGAVRHAHRLVEVGIDGVDRLAQRHLTGVAGEPRALARALGGERAGLQVRLAGPLLEQVPRPRLRLDRHRAAGGGDALAAARTAIVGGEADLERADLQRVALHGVGGGVGVGGEADDDAGGGVGADEGAALARHDGRGNVAEDVQRARRRGRLAAREADADQGEHQHGRRRRAEQAAEAAAIGGERHDARLAEHGASGRHDAGAPLGRGGDRGVLAQHAHGGFERRHVCRAGGAAGDVVPQAAQIVAGQVADGGRGNGIAPVVTRVCAHGSLLTSL
ncbi:MAG: hypothetical protein ACYTGX_13520 [Planctomycetota bacterium]